MRNTCQRPVSGGPGGSCWTGKLTEVASEGLLAPRAVDRVADGREGRDRLVLVVVLEENGQGPVAPHGVAHERGVRGVDVRELFHQVDGELLRDVVVHLPVLPLGLGGVDVEPCARFCRVSRFCEFGGVGPRDGIAEKVGRSGKSAASAKVDRSEKLSRSNLRAFPTPSSFPAHTNVRTTLSRSLCVCRSVSPAPTPKSQLSDSPSTLCPLGEVSGKTTAMPCSSAYLWIPLFCEAFSSVQVRPDR